MTPYLYSSKFPQIITLCSGYYLTHNKGWALWVSAAITPEQWRQNYSEANIQPQRDNVVGRTMSWQGMTRQDNVVTAMSSCAELTGQLQPSGDPATVASCWQTILVCQNISTDWNQTISCLTLHHLVSTWSTWYAGRGDGHSKQTLNLRPWDNGGGGLNWFPLLVYLCIWAPWKRAE